MYAICKMAKLVRQAFRNNTANKKLHSCHRVYSDLTISQLPDLRECSKYAASVSSITWATTSTSIPAVTSPMVAQYMHFNV